MAETSEYFEKKVENPVDFSKFYVFLRKLNPYKKTETDAEGKIMEAVRYLYWRSFSRWVIDVALNGVFLNVILWGALRAQPLNGYIMLIDGLLVWFISVILNKLWNAYVAGKIKIVREMPK